MTTEPMSGPDHYQEAQRLLDEPTHIRDEDTDIVGWTSMQERVLLRAQVHATLALTAATVDASPSSHARDIWQRVLG